MPRNKKQALVPLISFKIKQTANGAHCANTWYFTHPSTGSNNACFCVQFPKLIHIGKLRFIICCLLELAKLFVASLALHRQAGYTHSVLAVAAYWLG